MRSARRPADAMGSTVLLLKNNFFIKLGGVICFEGEGDALQAAGALGRVSFDLRIIEQGLIDQAAVIGIQRAHLKGLAAAFDFFRELLDLGAQFFFLHAAEMGAIDLDARRVLVVLAQQAIHQILQVIQPIALIADQPLGLRGGNLQTRPLLVLLQVDGGGKTEVTEHGIQHFFRGIFSFHG